MRALMMVLALAACAGDKSDDDDDDGSGSWQDDTGGSSEGYNVALETTQGTIVVALEEQLTPETTSNFLAYVDAGFYDGSDGQGYTVFHRVVPGFVAQGGGWTTDGVQKDTMAAITLETDLGLSNLRGTIAMARTDTPNSATSQFYFNFVDNTDLDFQSSSQPGYAVFGGITEGLEVLDQIEALGSAGGTTSSEIAILSATRQ